MKIDYKSFAPVNPKIIKSSLSTPLKSTPLCSEKKKTLSSLTDSFHSPSNRVPVGDSPYVKAKHVQDASKDVWMKHHNHADDFIEAIKLFRNLCSQQAQESLDDVLIDLYKRAGSMDEHIQLLGHKLQLVKDGVTKTARAGEMFCCSIEQEKSRLLGNLGWAYIQQEKYQLAEELYRKALPSKGPHQNHGLGAKWTGKDPRLRVSDMNGSDSSFGQDMVEKEEEKEGSLSLFSSENTVESVSEWSNSEDSSYISQETDIRLLVVDDLNDAEYTLQKQFEEVGINGEFRNYKRGTVIIVFLDGSKLYVVSDSRLSYEFINPDTKVKEYRICYRNKVKCEGLRVKVEEVGEKITACEGFLTALAGNYKIAHHVCENLKQMWINEEIGSDHRFFAERLEDHSTDTDFILVTPTNMGGFQISSVKDNEVRPMVGRLLCLGSGAGLAEKIILEKLKTLNQEISTVEMLKEVVYEVCGEENTVGGVVTVAVSEVVGESDKDKKLKTEFFRFPPLKRVWPITVLDDGIQFAKDDSFLLIDDKNVLDFGILEHIEEGDLSDYPVRPDLVRVRIFLDATDDPWFYHASNYSERTDFVDFEYSVLSYNQAKQKFNMVLESSKKETRELYESIIVGKTRMFWDNENIVFVIC